MKTIRNSLLLMLALLAFLLGSCAPGDGPAALQPVGIPNTPAEEKVQETAAPQDEVVTQEPQVSASDPSTPEGVAALFFEAYAEAIRNRQPALGNPEFEAQKYLSDDYLKQVAEIKAGFEGGGFDPVLQAQDVPPASVEASDVQVDGDQATVTLQFGRNVLEQPWERSVSLEKIEEQWKIVPDRVDGGGKSPDQTVQAFYDWYLAYIGSGEQARNPLADRAYRAAPYLAADLVGKVDRMAEEGFQFDPFLCAQDVPAELKPVASFYNEARPVVVMGSSFSGHYLIADLARTNFNWWAIRNITCASTPQGAAKAFYTWLLGYSTEGGELRNPWVEGAYQESDFLSQAFKEELERLMASGEPLVADPALLAQDLPQDFNTEACQEENCALVNMQFGQAMVRQLKVELVQENGMLKIARISHPEGPQSPQPAQEAGAVEAWAPFVDEQYGYALRFPADWSMTASKVTDLHTPEEYWVMRSVRFYPPQEGDQLFSFQVEVIVGDQTTVSNSYPADQIEETEINGYPVTVYRSEPGIISYIFQHPGKENVWVVFTDSISQFPGRETTARQVEGVFDAMLSTVAFVQ